MYYDTKHEKDYNAYFEMKGDIFPELFTGQEASLAALSHFLNGPQKKEIAQSNNLKHNVI